MRSIGVFCGANHGLNEIYRAAAAKLGAAAAQSMILVYGGKAIGVIPQSLADREVAHQY